MKHGVWLRCSDSVDSATLVEVGAEAEDAGWDGVFVSDSLPFAEYPDPWVLLAAIAAQTDSLELGTWVVPVPRREPWQVAQEVATLDRLSGGRVLFGVGLGNDDDYEAYGRPYDLPALGARFDEALEVITDLWAGDPVTYDGDHFTLDAATVEPTPIGDVPILAGAWWPNKKPFHRGARYDGILPWFPSMSGGETGPHGEEPSGEPMEEIRDAMAYYHEITDDSGEVVLPTLPDREGAGYLDEYADLGATWALTVGVAGDETTLREAVGAGPPR